MKTYPHNPKDGRPIQSNGGSNTSSPNSKSFYSSASNVSSLSIRSKAVLFPQLQPQTVSSTTGASTPSTMTKPPLLTKSVSDSELETGDPTSSNDRKPYIFFTKKNRNMVYNARPWQSARDDSAGLKQGVPSLKRTASDMGTPAAGPASKVTHLDALLMPPPTTLSSSPSKLLTGKASNTNSPMKLATGNPTYDPEVVETIRSVKDARECQERGEVQNLLDDIEYIIDGLKPALPVNARAFSMHTLLIKCLAWEMRRKFRNRRILTWIWHQLRDMQEHPILSFSVAAFLYVLLRQAEVSQCDVNCLRIVFQLTHYESGPLCPPSKTFNSIHIAATTSSNVTESLDGDRIRAKLLQALEEFHKSLKSQGNPKNGHQEILWKHLRLGKTTRVSDLMLELMLSLQLRKNSATFKEDIRVQGALQVIADTVIAAADYLGNDLGPQTLDDLVMERVQKLVHYLHLLEDVTFRNRDNQEFLAHHKDRGFLDALARCLRLCVNNVPTHPPESETRRLLVECLTAVLGLLLNISCDNEFTSERVGACPYLLDLAMHVTLRLAPTHVPETLKTDVFVISLGLMVNLAEHSAENRARIMHLHVATSELFEAPQGGLEDDETDARKASVYLPAPMTVNVSAKRESQVAAVQELVQLFTTLERAIQEHEFEKAGDPVADPSEKPAEEANGVQEPLRFHLIEAGKRRRSQDGLTSPEDPDASKGADVEFEANTAEEKEQLQKKLDLAEVHMKDSMVCAYLALLLGCLLQNNPRYSSRIRNMLPDRNFRLLAYMLAKLHNFLQLTQAIGEEEQKSVERIVRVLEEQDGVS